MANACSMSAREIWSGWASAWTAAIADRVAEASAAGGSLATCSVACAASASALAVATTPAPSSAAIAQAANRPGRMARVGTLLGFCGIFELLVEGGDVGVVLVLAVVRTVVARGDRFPVLGD